MVEVAYSGLSRCELESLRSQDGFHTRYSKYFTEHFHHKAYLVHDCLRFASDRLQSDPSEKTALTDIRMLIRIIASNTQG